MSDMNFPALTVQDYGRGAYLVTTAEKPIPLRSVAYVGDESTQILNADDGETARRFAYLFAAAPQLLAALKEIANRGPLPGYGSAEAMSLRLVGSQSIARAAIAAAEGKAVKS